MKDMKDFVPKFLLDSVDEAFKTLELDSKGKLYDILTEPKTEETAKLIRLVNYVSTSDIDILAVLGKYVMQGRKRLIFDRDYTVYTRWDALLDMVAKVNKLFAELEKDLCQQTPVVIQDKERITEYKGFYDSIVRFHLDTTDGGGEDIHINLRMKVQGHERKTLFYCSFTDSFDSRTNYKNNWRTKFKSVINVGLPNNVWVPSEVNIDEIIDKHGDSIDSAIFSLLSKLTTISTEALPGSVMVSSARK